MSQNLKWCLPEAVELCGKIEAICPKFGCHVALTGGVLYKEGPRKDLDLLFYRIRDWKQIDHEGMFKALEIEEVFLTGGFGWCYKGEYHGKKIDLFFPEEKGGTYEEGAANSVRRDLDLPFEIDFS